jgi:ABC-2 type transport system ATP-binding protein
MVNVQVRNLTKKFGAGKFSKIAVENLTFDIPKGRVVGFVGPNGSGKTTTMRMMLGLAHANSGTATFDGVEYKDLKRPLEKVGVLIDAKAFHKNRSARSHIEAFAVTHGYSKKRVDEVLEITGLTDVQRKKVGKFSLGMAQRVSIATALLGDPELLILDEPANGLDPEGVMWIRNLCRDYAARGRSVLISSHLLSEIESTVDDVLIIGKGKLIAHKSLSELTSNADTDAIKIVTQDYDRLAPALTQIGANILKHEYTTKYNSSKTLYEIIIKGVSLEDVASVIAAQKIIVFEISMHKQNLEEAFLDLTMDAVEYKAQDTLHNDSAGSSEVAVDVVPNDSANVVPSEAAGESTLSEYVTPETVAVTHEETQEPEYVTPEEIQSEVTPNEYS